MGEIEAAFESAGQALRRLAVVIGTAEDGEAAKLASGFSDVCAETGAAAAALYDRLGPLVDFAGLGAAQGRGACERDTMVQSAALRIGSSAHVFGLVELAAADASQLLAEAGYG